MKSPDDHVSDELCARLAEHHERLVAEHARVLGDRETNEEGNAKSRTKPDRSSMQFVDDEPITSDEDSIDGDSDVDDELAECIECLELLDRVRRRALPETLAEFDSVGEELPEVDDADEEFGPLPREIGRYEIVRQIGAGGLGIVFEARDPKLGRRVALKIPRPELMFSRSLRRRFVVEGEAASRLNHPHIVTVYDAGEQAPYLYIASEYLPGPNLAQWLAGRTESVPIDLAVTIVRQLAEGVSHAHSRGILHRDIKPSNVLIARGESSIEGSKGGPLTQPSPGGRGLWEAEEKTGPLTPPSPGGSGSFKGGRGSTDGYASFTVKLGDFGLAKLVDQEVEHTRTGQVLGTVAYMSPEQAEGKSDELDIRADVYSLGIVLYQLLTGLSPFERKSGPLAIAAVVHDEPPAPRKLRAGIPRDLEAICLKSIAKRKEQRYATAAEFAEDLGRFLEGKPTIALPATPPQRLFKWARRKPALASLYGVLLASLFVLLAFYVRSEIQIRSSLAREREARKAAQIHSYTADMVHAQQCFDEGNTPLLLETLKRYIPEPGDDDLRTFTWFHLWHKVHRSERTLLGHDGDVYSISYSPDGQRLASGGADGTVRIWDPASGKEIFKYTLHKDGCNVVKHLSAGRQFVSIGDDGKLMLIDTASRNPPRMVWKSEHRLTALAVRKDGKLIAVGDDLGAVTLLESQRWSVQRSWKAHTSDIHGLDFSPDGNLLLTGGKSGGVTVWEAANGLTVGHLDESTKPISSVGFSPDGKYARLSYRTTTDSLTQVYSIKTASRRGPPKSAKSYFKPLGSALREYPTWAKSISGDGKVVVGYYQDRPSNARVRRAFRWTEDDGFQSLDGLEESGEMSIAQATSRDGSVVVGAIGKPDRAFRWTAATGIQLLEDLPGGKVESIAFSVSGDGTVVAGISHSDRGFEPVRWVDGKIVSLLPRNGPHEGPHFNAGGQVISADGSTIAGRISRFNDSTVAVSLWNATDGYREIPAPEGSRGIEVRAISRDGRHLAGEASFRPDIGWRWSEEYGMDLFQPPEDGSPNIQNVCCMASDASFYLGWHRRTEEANSFLLATTPADTYWYGVPTQQNFQDACSDLGLGSVIPSGWKVSWLAGISDDQRRIVGEGLSPAGRAEVFMIELPPRDELGPVIGQRLVADIVDEDSASPFGCYASAFSADSKSILTSDSRGNIKLSDVTARNWALLQDHVQRIWDLQTSSDGKWMASASADGTIKIWNIERPGVLDVITESESRPMSAAWSPDGQRLALGFRDGTTRICNRELQTLATAVYARGGEACDDVVFSPDSKQLFISHASLEIGCFDAHTGAWIRNLGPESVGALCIEISHDGRWLACQMPDKILLLGLEGQQPRPPITEPEWEFRAMALSSRRPLQAIAFPKRVELWDLDSGKKLREYRGFTAEIRAIAFSHNDKWLAAGGDDHEIYIWDVESGERVATLLGHTQAVVGVSWCSDGVTLVSMDGGGRVHLWDMRTRQTLLRRIYNRGGLVQFSPDGQVLLVLQYFGVAQLEIFRAPRTPVVE